MKRYEKLGEAYLFWIRGLVNNLPENEKGKFKSKLRKFLREYEFQSRKKSDPPHPNSIELIKEEKPLPTDTANPSHALEIILTLMHPYYSSGTQNRIKRYIEKNL